MLLVWLTPLSMQAFGTTPTGNSTNTTIVAGCDGVTVTGGSGSIAIAGLGSYSHILVFTPGFASKVFDQEISTATLTVPITTAGEYIVKVWSNPNPGEFCENNFPVTVGGGGGGSTLTLNGCNNASATAAAGATTAVVTYTMPTATTTCAAGGATVTRTSGGASGTAFPVGSSQVCFSATDACGNTQTCCITITVTATAGGCSNVTNGGTISKACNNGSITLSGTAPVGGSGTLEYQWLSATGACPTETTQAIAGATNATLVVNSASVTATTFYVRCVRRAGCSDVNSWVPGESNCISIAAGECPTTGGGSNICTSPAANIVGGSGSISITGITTGCSMIQVFNSSWSSVYSQQVTGTTVTIPSLTAGSYIVKVTVLGAGCAWPSVCDVQITVTVGGGVDPCATDAIAPAFVGCPTNINLTTTGTCANASWTAPTATDNCGTPTVAQVLGGANGSCFPVGTTLVKYMATDAKGNTAICVFNVVVTKIVVDPCATDVTAPVLVGCPANIVKTPASAGSCWTVSWTAPTATDNCGTPTVTQTAGPSNGSCLAPGTYTVTYKATDAKGNSVTCSFTITVKTFLNCNSVTGNTISKTCVNNVPSLNGSALAGYEYQWLSSTSGCPSLNSQAIAGATGQHYTLPSRVAHTTYFVRCARQIGCTTWGPINESNCITVYTTDCAPAVCSPRSTPNGWMYLGVFGTSHYFKYTVGDVTNADARSKAASIGGRLPVIKTTAQNTFIQSKLGTGNAWVGIRRSGSNWVWDNNAYASYFNWAAGEPNNYGGVEHCAAMYGHSGQWNDANCANYNWCIAEIPCAGLNVYLATNDQVSLNATAEVNSTRLEWTNNTGYKNDYYEVQKLNQKSGEFEQLSIVNNTSFSDAPSYQSAYDETPTEGDNFYRVKVVYLDSISKFSEVKKLVFNGLETVKLFPNPANDYVDIDLSKFNNETISVYLYNSFGKQVAFQLVEKDKFSIVHFDISNQDTGNYTMRITARGKRDVVRPLQIVR